MPYAAVFPLSIALMYHLCAAAHTGNGIGQGETAVQAGPSAYTFTQNPHKATFAPSPATRLNAPSTLDHVKHLQLRQATRTRDDAKTVLSITMASQVRV